MAGRPNDDVPCVTRNCGGTRLGVDASHGMAQRKLLVLTKGLSGGACVLQSNSGGNTSIKDKPQGVPAYERRKSVVK